MRKTTLIEALADRPFTPVVVHMSNGRQLEIRHPENAMVADDHAAIMVSDNGRTRIRIVALEHINELEPITVESA